MHIWLGVLLWCLLSPAEFDDLEPILALVPCHVPPSAGKIVYREHKFIKYTKLDVPIGELVLRASVKQASRGVAHHGVSKGIILLSV